MQDGTAHIITKMLDRSEVTTLIDQDTVYRWEMTQKIWPGDNSQM